MSADLDGFAAPHLYAGGRRCFVAADIVDTWDKRGFVVPWWTRWEIAEARRDYRVTPPGPTARTQ